MKLKLFFSFAFLFFLTASKAQIHYTDEEIKNKYDHETLMLQQDGAEKNGMLIRFNYLFPSRLLREEIDKNGGKEAQTEYQEYKKAVGFYWLVSVIGIIAMIITVSLLITSAGTVNFTTAYVLYLLLVLGFTALIMYFSKKAFRHLARSIWLFNRNVLLKK